MNNTPLMANWNYPTNIKVGAGRIKEITGLCYDLNIKAPLIVTDPSVAALPFMESILEYAQASDLTIGLFKDIKSNPTGNNILQGLSAYQDGGHDGIIAIGGGSAIDAGKAIALMIGQHRPLWDFEDIGDNWKRVNVSSMSPVIAIPTTAGTGSEVGRASVITDQEEHTKKIIFHPNMLPKQVILDPELTIGLPPHLTAATGIDALSHNLESYCTEYYHPMAEGIALEGIRLIKEYLPQAVRDGKNIEARTHLLVASSMGATAFQRGLGAMHALAHPLGALYDAHHGRLNAILMPYVLLANRSAIERKIEPLASYLKINGGFNGFIDWILELRHDLKIEHTLAELGIDDQHLVHLSNMATQDAAAQSNPIRFNSTQYQAILSDAIHGHLENKGAQ